MLLLSMSPSRCSLPELGGAVFLTAYLDHTPSSVQYKWFIADMTTNLNRTLTPWVIVVRLHHVD